MRRTLLGLGAAGAMQIATSGAYAQQFQWIPQPLSDTNCNFGQIDNSTPPCTVLGSRDVTNVVPETVTRFGTIAEVSGQYRVSFQGDLQMDGVNSIRPYGFFGPDISALMLPSGTANVTTTYDATLQNGVAHAGSANTVERAFFTQYSNFQTTVNSITVASPGYVSYRDPSGVNYSYSFQSANPTAIINGNSTALTGSYSGGDRPGFSMGVLVGTATLQQGTILTPQRDPSVPSRTLNYTSPFALEYQLTRVETTHLDEKGLTTPTVAVTNGINMNGSQVTNLAAGTAPTDAVNRSQLDEEATARASADLAISERVNVVAASQQAIGSAMANETNARLAADIEMASQVDALGGRLDEIDGRLDRMQEHVASSTATAVALSGNSFLPDMRFNLTANVATYDGAHAGSVQFGAIVSRNVAVNAGVAKGMNKRGKTAARAGVTFGW